MLKRLAERCRVPVGAFVLLSMGGPLFFGVMMAIATHAFLVKTWPDLPAGVAWPLAVVAPPICVLGVGIVCAVHDRLRFGSKELSE